jgi:GTP-binding protein
MFDSQKFIKSVYDLKELPKQKFPEVILCGRSNVGKSSFINSLFNRKDLAKTSSTPGKTRSINYYLIDDKFYFVDLPGYGYAKASIKERKYWGKLIGNFISESGNIMLAFHIIDSRHKPTELDLQLNQILVYNEIPYIIIFTKSDKLKQSEYAQAQKRVKELFPEIVQGENFFFYSSHKNIGRKEVIKRLSGFLKDSDF